MGGGSSRNTGEDSTTAASSGRGDFSSADTVMGLSNFANTLQGMDRGLAQAGGAAFGPIGMLAGLVPRGVNYLANRSWDSFNRGVDSNAAARAAAMGLGGMGTYSDRQGNLGTISNQALIDAYDRETFGSSGSQSDFSRSLSQGRSYDGGGSYSNSDQAARDAGNES
jgi:hypothetical protein